jgi:hypothetical protein
MSSPEAVNHIVAADNCRSRWTIRALHRAESFAFDAVCIIDARYSAGAAGQSLPIL